MKNLKNSFAQTLTIIAEISFSLLFKRTTVVILLLSLLTPTLMFGDFQKVKAAFQSSSVSQSAPQSAPPEVFLVSGGNSLPSSIVSGFGSLISFSSEKIFGLFASPAVPLGLEQPDFKPEAVENEPAENNEVNSSVSSAPLVLPSGSVRFDFDGDGKADVGRWHASNTEWKVRNSSNGNYTTNTNRRKLVNHRAR